MWKTACVRILVTTLLVLMLLLATRVFVDFDEDLAYIVCGLCVGISGGLFLIYPEASEYVHILSISLVTLYQSHFVLEEANAAIQLQVLMATVVVGVYIADYYVWYIAWSHSDNESSKEARKWHGPICNLLLGFMAYIPLPGAGMFNVKNPYYLLVFAALQLSMSVTEGMRNIRVCQFSTPHSALKCLPLLYLQPWLWCIFVVFLKLNCIFLYLDRKKIFNKERD